MTRGSSYIARNIEICTRFSPRIHKTRTKSIQSSFVSEIKTVMAETKLPRMDFVVLLCKANILGIALGINEKTEYYMYTESFKL